MGKWDKQTDFLLVFVVFSIGYFFVELWIMMNSSLQRVDSLVNQQTDTFSKYQRSEFRKLKFFILSIL